MKRRNFLGLFGAAVTAPALSMAAPAISGNVAARATAHAQKYPFVSALGLSKSLGLSAAQAEHVLLTLSRKGLIGKINSYASGAVHARSCVYQPVDAVVAQMAKAKQAAHAAKAKRMSQAQVDTQGMKSDLSALVAHLRKVCVDNGMTLDPRCFA